MRRRRIPRDTIALSPKEATFVLEYVKDSNARRAAEAIGLDPDSGHAYKKRANVSDAIYMIVQKTMEEAVIDSQWVLNELVDNHMLARYANNLPASNSALGMVMKHTEVDAIASDKMNVNVTGDKEVMARLLRGRKRAGKTDDAAPVDDEVSFF